MSRYVFNPQELPILLRQHQHQFTTGYLHVYLRAPGQLEVSDTWLLAFFQGRLIFSSDQHLDDQVFLGRLARYVPRLKQPWAKRALQVMRERMMWDQSIPALVEGMTELVLLKPGELEDAIWLNLLTDMDRYLFDRAGTCRFEVHDILARETPIGGFELDPILQQAAERRDQWNQLQVIVPTMSAVPVVNWERVNRYTKITEEQKQKLHALTRDAQSMESIAAQLARDPLEVAHMFATWLKKGLISLETPPDLLQEEEESTYRILAVDDSVVMQQILLQSLPNYDVFTTGNPTDVLNMVFQHRPDLLILDVTMPGIDGLELCRIVRNLEEFKHLPIILLTSRSGLFDRIKGKLSGATAYLTKPFNEVQLNEEIERLLANRSIARSQHPKTQALQEDDDLPEAATDWPDSMYSSNPGT